MEGATRGVASAAPSNFIRCRRCSRALSAHWARNHRAEMRGVPVCNCCRTPQVPLRPVHRDWKGDPYPESGEPMSGSTWSDPLVKAAGE